jgi:fucose permease
MSLQTDEGVELQPLVNGKTSLEDVGGDDSPRDSLDIEVPLTEDTPGPSKSERWTKIFVLLLACTFSIGSHYSQSCIGPLKDILKNELSINDSQFSLILGSNLVANTVVPIIAGILVARFGTLKSSVFATGALFLGQAINLIAVIRGSVPGMILGLCLFG